MTVDCARGDCTQPADDGVYLCAEHTFALANHATIAAARYDSFEGLLLGSQHGTYSEKVSGSKVASVGFNEYACEIRGEISDCLGLIVADIITRRGLETPKTFSAPVLAKIIVENHRWLAATKDAGEASEGLEYIARNPRYRLPEPGKSRPWPLTNQADGTQLMCQTHECEGTLWYVTVNDDGFVACDSTENNHATPALEWLGATAKGN